MLVMCSSPIYSRVQNIAGLSAKDRSYVQSFPHLHTQEAIDDWKSWVEAHPNPNLQSWYKSKEPYPWYFPSLNEILSLMPPGFFKLMPKNSNLGESGHVGTNKATGIRLSPVAGMEK